MPFTSSVHSSVLYVSWSGLGAEDLPRVVDLISELRFSTRAPVVYLCRIPADRRVFTEAERAALLGFLQTILPSCSSIHHVIEGDGFIRSARTSIVTSLAFATSRPRDFYTHATLAEAVAWLAEAHDIDLGELLKPRSKATASSPSPARRRSSKPPRASSAFRAAVRIATRPESPPKKRKP
jgi:hypothetical protein